MAGDDRTVFLFLLSMAAAFGFEAMRAETAPRRGLFVVGAAVCALAGIFWLQVKTFWPPLTAAVASVATDPISWFVILMFVLSIIAFQPRKAREALPPQSEPEPVAPPAVTLPVAVAEPRQFVDIIHDTLLKLRAQQNLTRVQTDRMLAPYIGKWIRVTGVVNDIFQKILFLKVEPAEPARGWNVTLKYDDANRDSFHLLGAGQTITVVGRINSVGFGDIELDSAELENSR
jgi:hypothetical protein